MPKYRLTGNYGTFEIAKVVEADNEEEALLESGIMVHLVDAGWEVVSAPDGEEWTAYDLAEDGPMDDDWISRHYENHPDKPRSNTDAMRDAMLEDIALDRGFPL